MRILVALFIYLLIGFKPIQIEAQTNNLSTISVGWRHAVAIGTDGSLWTWGENRFGQLGDGSTTNRNTPTRIGRETNWASVTAGNDYTLAIKADGSLWAWGNNFSGQLGDGTSGPFNRRLTPTRIGTATNWISVSAGSDYTVAIRSDGSLWVWGRKTVKYFGHIIQDYGSTPTRIGIASNWLSVSAGWSHTLAIRTDGSLWAWGENNFGQLGDGTTNNHTSPVRVGNATNWALISAGHDHSLAVREDGSLWAWGQNNIGMLGDGTTINRLIPTRIGTSLNWTNVSAGQFRSLAIRSDGSLWAWGDLFVGTLENNYNDGERKNTPTQIGSETNWISVFEGRLSYIVGIRFDGSFWAWGGNPERLFGDGTVNRQPVQIMP